MAREDDDEVTGGDAPLIETASVGNDTALSIARQDSLWYGVEGAEDDELIGTELSGTYRVVRVLGQGGMGRIYLAQHTRIAAKVFAIKVLRPEFARHEEARERFRREAEAAASIDSHHVVGVWDVDHTPDGMPFMACEYLEGIDLGEYLDQARVIPVEQALRIARDVARGLAAAHAKGVIHRDVKPENVFLTGDMTDPVVKLLDFGLSKIGLPSAKNLTGAGIIMGTPSYMAPEMAAGKTVDHRADLYGVGLILYRALTGIKPFDDEDPASTLMQVLTKDAEPPRARNPKIPEHVEQLILRAMAKSPDERFQTAEMLADALSAALSARDGRPRPPPPPRRRPAGEDDAPALESSPAPAQASFLALTAYLFAALALLTAAVATGAVELGMPLPRAELQSRESWQVMVALFLAPLGLAAIAAASLRRRSNRVVKSARNALLIGAAAYGGSMVLLRFGDAVVGSLVDTPLLLREPGVAWRGWSALLPAISLLAVAAWAIGRDGTRRARLARSIAGAAGFGAAAILLYVGLAWRASGAVPDAAPADAPRVTPTESAVVAAKPPAPHPEPVTEEEPEPAGSAEPDDESIATPEDLAAAKEGGTEALESLLARHPRDPAVLAALIAEHARDKSSYPRALELAAPLLEVEPERARDKSLRMLVLEATQMEEVADRAYELLAEKMGSEGPDILYDLMISTPRSQQRAQALLATPEVRDRSSEALRVAFDLRSAESCDEALDLLERASAHGDRRSLVHLSAMIHGTRRGCGPNKQQPCPAECDEHADPIQGAIDAIQTRIGR